MGKYKFFSDAGHSWLQVPAREVTELGIDISKHSYVDRSSGMFYLEEEADVKSFIEAKMGITDDAVYSAPPDLPKIISEWCRENTEDAPYEENSFVRDLEPVSGYLIITERKNG